MKWVKVLDILFIIYLQSFLLIFFHSKLKPLSGNPVHFNCLCFSYDSVKISDTDLFAKIFHVSIEVDFLNVYVYIQVKPPGFLTVKRKNFCKHKT